MSYVKWSSVSPETKPSEGCHRRGDGPALATQTSIRPKWSCVGKLSEVCSALPLRPFGSGLLMAIRLRMEMKEQRGDLSCHIELSSHFVLQATIRVPTEVSDWRVHVLPARPARVQTWNGAKGGSPASLGCFDPTEVIGWAL